MQNSHSLLRSSLPDLLLHLDAIISTLPQCALWRILSRSQSGHSYSSSLYPLFGHSEGALLPQHWSLRWHHQCCDISFLSQEQFEYLAAMMWGVSSSFQFMSTLGSDNNNFTALFKVSTPNCQMETSFTITICQIHTGFYCDLNWLYTLCLILCLNLMEHIQNTFFGQ